MKPFSIRSVVVASGAALLALVSMATPIATAQDSTIGLEQIGSAVNPGDLTNVGGTLYFAAGDAAHGRELWKSDGTDAGTKRIRDIRSGNASSYPAGLVNVGGVLYFEANDGTHGTELWRSDGTYAGTKLVKDIRSGSKGSAPDNLTAVGATLYLSANDGAHGVELWKSNGVAAGTKLVKDLNPGASGSGLRFFLSHAGKLFFTQMPAGNPTDQCPWTSDGSSAGTARITSGFAGCDAAYPVNVGGKLYFAVDNGIWTLNDATGHGQVVSNKPNSITALTNVAGTLFFGAINPVSDSGLWKSDGTDAGTKLIKDVTTEVRTTPEWIAAAGPTAYFSIEDCTDGTELWKSDGTHLGTVLVKDIYPGTTSGEQCANGSFPYSPVAIGGTLYFAADDGVHGYELWKTDGSDIGTQRLTDINPSGDAGIGLIANVGGTLFFNATDGVHGPQLWSYTP